MSHKVKITKSLGDPFLQGHSTDIVDCGKIMQFIFLVYYLSNKDEAGATVGVASGPHCSICGVPWQILSVLFIIKNAVVTNIFVPS